MNPNDSPITADARLEMANIQRRHRAERRHGDEASPTPSLAELRLRHRSFLPQLNKDNPAAAPAFPPSDSMGNIPLSPSFGMGSIPQSSSFGSAERQASGGGGGDAFGSPLPPDHFVCNICHVARAYGRRVIAVMVDSEGLLCVWCNFQTTGQNFQRELKWCLSVRHERPRAEFKIPQQEQFQLAHIEHLDEDEEGSCRRCLIRDGILIGDTLEQISTPWRLLVEWRTWPSTRLRGSQPSCGRLVMHKPPSELLSRLDGP